MSELKSIEDLREQVTLFDQLKLPGQPAGIHMGTSYLVHDLLRALEEERRETLTLERALSNRGASFARVRKAMRYLVTAAAAIMTDHEEPEAQRRHDLWQAVEKALAQLEDLATEASFAADFDAGAAFDLFWPDGLPPPAPNLSRFACVPRDGEPSFTLLGRDAASDGLVDIWCEARRMLIAIGLKPKGDHAKVIEAHNIAQRMREYRENLATGERLKRAAPVPDSDNGAGENAR